MVNIKITKGVDIKLTGEAEKVLVSVDMPDTVVVKPPDFEGLTPKLTVKAGDNVKAGSVLFYDKNNDQVKFTAPISGEIAEIVRGAKRRILEVRILADKEIQFEEFQKGDPNSMSKDQIVDNLLKSGVWPFIRQRPFSSIANPSDTPKAIFISCFDTNPLAPDSDFVLHSKGDNFQKGLDAISKLTEGKVHLNINPEIKVSKVFSNSKGVQINNVTGPHPAGNVGVQIHHIDPINKGDIVWYLSPQDVLTVGALFAEGKFDASRIVALTGSSVKNPKYVKSYVGTAITKIVKDNVEAGNQRYISGNVLSGSKISSDGYLGFYDAQITVIPEGDEPEFMGWMAPGLDKMSVSRTFLSWLMPSKKYTLTTNLRGEERAYVMTGQYEQVFPMDIYPMHLIKAIMVGDIELMENLGIYEVAPEDFALCEFVCTSKMDVQEIVREGIEMVREG
ncbi:MAG: Na(+)-translocating NADH-quinone reductase subunit A [Flavobacteriales bacterium]|nr:Na(+)-translocating NADH-quinone reductase subunit A [Flavobacteriales bacterium]